jgi:hypothetical protein
MSHQEALATYHKHLNRCIFYGDFSESSFYLEGVPLETRVKELEKDVVDIKTRLAVAESSIKDIKEDLSSIKNNTAWIIRLIVGAIILAVLGFISNGVI